MMSRKDFVKIAAALAENRPSGLIFAGDTNAAQAAWGRCVVRIAGVMQTDNPRFNRSRFYAACKYDESAA